MKPAARSDAALTTAVAEVEARLQDAAKQVPEGQAAFRQRYHGAVLPHLGLTLPQQRTCFRLGYSFSDRAPREQLVVWDRVWRSGRHHETRSQALFFGQTLRDPAILLRCWPTLRGWVDLVGDWPHSDSLSATYVRVLEAAPDRVYPVLQRWNRSRNPWKRRQSIVSLLYYGSMRAKPLPASRILPLVAPLIADPDRFVQKGVGWTLRECHGLYPAETLAFLRERITELSAAAFSAATEKLTPAEKAPLKAARARARAKR